MDWSFRISCGWVHPVCILSREKSSLVSLINIKEELNSEYVLTFYTWNSLIRHLRQPLLSWTFSIFSSNSWWEMCSSGNWTRSVRPGGKYRSIRHTKISEIQTGIFDRMERALTFAGVRLTHYAWELAGTDRSIKYSRHYCTRILKLRIARVPLRKFKLEYRIRGPKNRFLIFLLT